MQNSPKEWLVKSGGQIKGPYTYDEVTHLITSKDVIFVDEIARSFGRWKLIRDEGAFEKTVLEMQNKYEASGDKTFTQTETDAITDEINQGLLNFSRKENLVPNEDRKSSGEQTIVSPHGNVAGGNEKVYGVNKKNSNKSKISKRQVSIIVGAAILFISSVVVLVNYKGKEQQKTFDDYKAVAMDLMTQGDLENATSAIKSALAIREENDLIFMLGTLELMNNEAGSALKNFELIKNRTKNPQTLAQIYNFLGVIHLKNYSLAAARLEFDAALEQSPQFVQAFYNKGVVDYFENKFEGAFNNFSQAMVHGGLDGTILLSMTEVLTKGKSSYSAEEQQKLSYYLGLILKHIQSFEVFRQELLIAAAFLQDQLGQNSESEKSVISALDIDPDLTTQHLLDISLYRGLVSWDVISSWVQNLSNKKIEDVNLKTLLGYSYFRGTEKFKGKELIETLLKSDYSNVSAQVIYGYIVYSLGQLSEAEVALQPIKENGAQTLGSYLLAKICFEKLDLDCTKLLAESVLKKNANHIGALTLLSKYFISIKSKEKAMEYSQKAYKLSSYSKDVLKTKKMAEGL